MDGRVFGEWYYLDGSGVIPVDDIGANQTDSHYLMASRSHSVIRLFHGASTPTMRGCLCCMLPDHHGSNQTLCVNIGNNYAVSAIRLYNVLSLHVQ